MVSACIPLIYSRSQKAFFQAIDAMKLGRKLYPEENVFLFRTIQVYQWLSTMPPGKSGGNVQRYHRALKQRPVIPMSIMSIY